MITRQPRHRPCARLSPAPARTPSARARPPGVRQRSRQCEDPGRPCRRAWSGRRRPSPPERARTNASQNNRTFGTAGTRGEREQHRERAADEECSAPVTQARTVREDLTRRGAEGRTDSAGNPAACGSGCSPRPENPRQSISKPIRIHAADGRLDRTFQPGCSREFRRLTAFRRCQHSPMDAHRDCCFADVLTENPKSVA